MRFAADWTVPFTNNEAERTIRFSKEKQRVSGCFRTGKGAQDYMQLMSIAGNEAEFLDRNNDSPFFQAEIVPENGTVLYTPALEPLEIRAATLTPI